MRVQRIALGLLLAGGLAQCGCATVAPSPERVVSPEAAYSGGRAMQDFSLPSTKVGTAVTEAMADLKMTSIEPGRDGVVYKIQAKTEDNRTVMVTLRPHQKMQTRVSCRVGLFGDEPLAKALLERTGVRLGTLPPAAIPDHVPSSPASNPFFSKNAVPDEEMLKDVAEAPYRDRVVP
jgi:Protein of unknown function (DUF3568)